MKKIITCLVSSVFCVVAATSFATATIGSATFCGDFIVDSNVMCAKMSPGNPKCNAHDRAGMDELYRGLETTLGGGSLDRGCQVATKAVGQESEKQNCIAKWNFYRANCH